MPIEQIVDEVATLIRHVRRDETLTIEADTRIDSLGVDSLDFVELLFELETKFDIDIPWNANADGSFPFETVGSAAEAISRLVAAKTVSA